MSNEQLVLNYLNCFFSSPIDFEELQSYLHKEFSFEGPLMTAESQSEYIEKIKYLMSGGLSYELESLIAKEKEVSVKYLLITPFGTFPTVEWFTIKDDKISNIQLFTDPRPFVEAFPQE